MKTTKPKESLVTSILIEENSNCLIHLVKDDKNFTVSKAFSSLNLNRSLGDVLFPEHIMGDMYPWGGESFIAAK